MNLGLPLRNAERSAPKARRAAWLVGALLVATVTVVSAIIIANEVDTAALGQAFRELANKPLLTMIALGSFGVAFLIRSIVWKRVLVGLSLGQAWAGIHVTLAANHVLPLRLGEPLRVASVVKRGGIGIAEATASTVTLRAADILTVVGLAWILGARNIVFMNSPLANTVIVGIGAVGLWGVIWIFRLRDRGAIRRPGLLELAGTLAAWAAESGLVLIVARSAGIELSLIDALFVTSVSVAAQIAAIAPGGFGTYEAGAVAAYVFLGYDPGVALAAALAAHALKTAYSLAVGIPALFFPSPSIIGRLRLRKDIVPIEPRPPSTGDGPIVLFMPAHNEEDCIADVLARIPERVLDHDVVTVVVDDGSTDTTAELAASAGVEVLSFAQNRGLGAAFRSGLIQAMTKDPVAVAYCDADGEYPPEELANLIAPILDGTADYVVGSRFSGNIEYMLPHRRFGNRVLTLALSLVARTRISDGQSGFRAFSPEAAADAEIIHDFNYAQVVTLDLLDKGYRYSEVPISYHFRTTGTSFIKLGVYLRNVIPAVYAELNRPTLDTESSKVPAS